MHCLSWQQCPATASSHSARCAGPYAGWRLPFVIVAVPTLLLAVLMLLTAEEPPRGVTEAALQVRPLALNLTLSLIPTLALL